MAQPAPKGVLMSQPCVSLVTLLCSFIVFSCEELFLAMDSFLLVCSFEWISWAFDSS